MPPTHSCPTPGGRGGSHQKEAPTILKRQARHPPPPPGRVGEAQKEARRQCHKHNDCSQLPQTEHIPIIRAQKAGVGRLLNPPPKKVYTPPKFITPRLNECFAKICTLFHNAQANQTRTNPGYSCNTTKIHSLEESSDCGLPLETVVEAWATAAEDAVPAQSALCSMQATQIKTE